jgi:pyruvate dehydrogenase (quinone)
MTRTVADDLWEMLHRAGVRRCYGIVGDALNPTIAALSRRSDIEFIHVRHEEFGAFAASAESLLTGQPVAVCGTAGPGVTHLLNGLLDARHERAAVIAVAGDVESSLIDTEAIEEISPYDLFRTASLYTGRVINPAQARAVFDRAISTSVAERGPTVIALPGDVAGADSPAAGATREYRPPAATVVAPSPADLDAVADLVNHTSKVMIFGGDGCRDAAAEVVALAAKLQAPVGFSYKGKVWLEGGNPNAVGMTGLLGYGGCYHALREAELVLMLGTDFPFPEFLTAGSAAIVQVDNRAGHLGRRVPLARAVLADVQPFVAALADRVTAKEDRVYLDGALDVSQRWRKRLRHYVDGGEKRRPIRPEYVGAVLDELIADDAIVTVDTGTPCIWSARHMTFGGDRRMIGSFSWASMANASPNAFGASLAYPGRQVVALCGDGGFSMLALGDLITEVQHGCRIVHVVFDNSRLDFVDIEQQEAGLVPFGTELPNPDFAKVAEAIGATGIRIEDPATLRDGLAQALAHPGGPVVVDVVVDQHALALPSHVPGETAKGFTLSLLKRARHGDIGGVLHEAADNVELL